MGDEQRAQVVDAVDVVGMFVGVEDAVEMIDGSVEQLLAQVRRGIHQHLGPASVRRRALDQVRRGLGLRCARASPGGRACGRALAVRRRKRSENRRSHAAAARS